MASASAAGKSSTHQVSWLASGGIVRVRSSATVPQRGRDAVDGEMDRAHRALVFLARAVAAQELHLHVVQRIEVGEAVADRARERGVVRQKLACPGDGEELLPRRVPLRFDSRKNSTSQLRGCE